LTGQRRMLKKIDEPVVLEGEIIDAPLKQQTDFVLDRQKQRSQEVTMKALTSLPDAIEIVKDIVSIQRVKAETDGSIRIIDAQIKYLHEETEKFIRVEIEKRNTFQSKSESAKTMLRDLYGMIKTSDDSDEVKKEILNVFNVTMKAILEER
jgi:hypothetical protein